MRRLGVMIGGGGAAAAAFLLLVGPINWSAGGDPSGSPTDTPTSASPSPTDLPSDDPSDEPTDDTCDRPRAVADYLYHEGFVKRDFVVGVSVVDWQKVPYVNDDGSFSAPLRTRSALTRFLEADTPTSKAARSLMGNDQADFVAVQFRTPVSYEGNWYWLDGRAKQGGRELSLAGDIWWFNVDADCTVDPEGSVRAVCGNVGLNWIEPATRVD